MQFKALLVAAAFVGAAHAQTTCRVVTVTAGTSTVLVTAPAPTVTVTAGAITSTTRPPVTTTTTRPATTTSGGGQCVAKYGQCGGQGWTGSTTCCSGSTCTASGSFYSQCL